MHRHVVALARRDRVGCSVCLGTTVSLDGSLDNRISGSSSVPESSWLLGMPWTTISLIGSLGYRGCVSEKMVAEILVALTKNALL